MTMPSAPLELHIQKGKLKVGEAKALAKGGADSLAAFTRILARFSNWTEAEIDDLEMDELEAIMPLVSAQMDGTVIPKAN